jgi:ParB family chromosome partitioning protein
MTDKRPALGKGLSALIPDAPPAPSASGAHEGRAEPAEVDIDLLTPNDFQPRVSLDDPRLDELARSITSNGIIQPIVVRRTGARYQIIAGERRWRAAQRAGLLKVPVVVRDVPAGAERQLLEMALIENLQREDLNPIDEASAYRRLAEEFHFTQDEIAASVGKDRSSVANHLRLLKLPDEVRASVAAGALSMGHARALLGLTDESAQRRLAREIAARNLSVRETEALVKKASQPVATREPPARQVDVHTRAAEDRLKLVMGTRVRIVRRQKGGTIEIDFVSEDELQRLYEQLTDRAR